MKSYEKTLHYLRTMKLKGIELSLDELVNDAETHHWSHISFLNALVDAEINYRIDKRLKRNLAAAHVPVEKQIDEYEFACVRGITKTEIANLQLQVDRQEGKSAALRTARIGENPFGYRGRLPGNRKRIHSLFRKNHFAYQTSENCRSAENCGIPVEKTSES